MYSVPAVILPVDTNVVRSRIFMTAGRVLANSRELTPFWPTYDLPPWALATQAIDNQSLDLMRWRELKSMPIEP
jgi:hypothetical protein